VVKKGGKICAQVAFMRAQEVIIASRGVSFSSDLPEELCERGIRVGCMTSSGRPVALITSPLLTATVRSSGGEGDGAGGACEFPFPDTG